MIANLTENSNSVNYEGGSFRDPEGRVFENQGEIYRTINPQVVERVRGMLESSYFQGLMSTGDIILTKMIKANDIGLDEKVIGSTLLHHERISPVTFPYEWSFDMLREAALNQLMVLEKSIDSGYILKDGTGFNNLYRNGKMCFIDILSIDKYQEGKPWEGYTQFCQEFLFPLMLTGYKDVEFQSWWRGTLKGLCVSDMNSLFTWKDSLRSGVLKHVILQQMLEKAFAGQSKKSTPSLKKNYFPKPALKQLVKSLRKTIEQLSYRHKNSVWFGYAEDNSYQESDKDVKEQFITESFEKMQLRQVVDLGANTGVYSRIAAQHAQKVISLDIDPACVNALYLELKNNPSMSKKIVPLVSNLVNPSPGQGWALSERGDLLSRIKSDAFMALALVHHICIASNVPLTFFVQFLRNVAPCGIVEWVDHSDQMVEIMLRNRKDIFQEYSWKNFSAELEKFFKITRVIELQNGTRKLCLLEKK